MFLSYLVWFGLVWWNARKAWRLRKVACTGSWKKGNGAPCFVWEKKSCCSFSLAPSSRSFFSDTRISLFPRPDDATRIPPHCTPIPSTLITPSVFSNKASLIAAPQKNCSIMRCNVFDMEPDFDWKLNWKYFCMKCKLEILLHEI